MDGRSATRVLGGMAMWIGLVVFGEAGVVAAPPGLPPEVEQAFERARSGFRPVTAERVAAARGRVAAAADALERWLASGELDEGEAAWKEYLHWDSFQRQLAADSPDLRALQRTAVRLYRHKAGLHLEPFTSFRDRLIEWINLQVAARQPDLESQYKQRLKQLHELCVQLQADPLDAQVAEQVGTLLGFFRRTGQDPALIAAVRTAFWHDNLYAAVSARLAAAGVEEPIDERFTMSDCIMGTSIRGTVHTTGKVTMASVPCDEHAVVRILVDGEAASNNTGWQRGVTIWSNSLTTLAAEVDIAIDGEGFEPSPVKAGAATSTDVYALSARSCLIERIAWRRVAKSKCQAEREASNHAASRLADQVSERVAKLLDEAERGFDEKFRQPLLRRGEWPSRLRFRSTANQFDVRMLQADVGQPGAPVPGPAAKPDRDLVVRLHETFVNNFARAILGGWTLTDERLEKVLKQFGEVPEELRTSSDKAPWSITFSATRPVSAVFRGNKVEFAIAGRRFEQGNNYVETPIRLSATYRVERTDRGAHLVREGDVVVQFTRLKKLGPTQIALRTVMRAKFEALFKPEFTTEGLQLPGRWEKAGKLDLQELVADRGWLALSWTLPPKTDATQAAGVSPAGEPGRRADHAEETVELAESR